MERVTQFKKTTKKRSMEKITAQELRIGNYIEYGGDNEVVESINYFSDGYRILIGNHLRPIEEIKPIPLTEEWLLKFGFENDGLSFFLSQQAEWNNDVYKFSQGGRSTIFLPCKYVHQLQNLYFALCGTELKQI